MHVRSASFVIRVHQDGDGRLSGVVERVRDRVRSPLPSDLTGLGDMIVRMLPPVERRPSVPDPTSNEEEREA